MLGPVVPSLKTFRLNRQPPMRRPAAANGPKAKTRRTIFLRTETEQPNHLRHHKTEYQNLSAPAISTSKPSDNSSGPNDQAQPQPPSLTPKCKPDNQISYHVETAWASGCWLQRLVRPHRHNRPICTSAKRAPLSFIRKQYDGLFVTSK